MVGRGVTLRDDPGPTSRTLSGVGLTRGSFESFTSNMSAERPSATSAIFDPERDVITEAAALQALAHPLRLRLLGVLRLFGPSTATRLATHCRESPALASYHLRQLAAAGLIVDAAPEDLIDIQDAHGRDRWWKAARRSTFTRSPAEGDDAAAAASGDYQQAVLAMYADRARSWLSAEHTWPAEWKDASTFSDVRLRLTSTEARQLMTDMAALLASYRRHDPASPPGRGDVPADALIVAAQYQVFPDPEQDPPHTAHRPST